MGSLWAWQRCCGPARWPPTHPAPAPGTHRAEGQAAHDTVLLAGLQLVEVLVCDQDGSVPALVAAVDLQGRRHLVGKGWGGSQAGPRGAHWGPLLPARSPSPCKAGEGEPPWPAQGITRARGISTTPSCQEGQEAQERGSTDPLAPWTAGMQHGGGGGRHVHMHKYIHICTCAHTRTHSQIYTHCMRIYVHMYKHSHIHMHTCGCTYAYPYILVHTRIHRHTCQGEPSSICLALSCPLGARAACPGFPPGLSPCGRGRRRARSRNAPCPSALAPCGRTGWPARGSPPPANGGVSGVLGTRQSLWPPEPSRASFMQHLDGRPQGETLKGGQCCWTLPPAGSKQAPLSQPPMLLAYSLMHTSTPGPVVCCTVLL